MVFGIVWKIAAGVVVVTAASVALHYFTGGTIVSMGQTESSHGNLWQWQVRRVGTDYAVLIILPAGDQVGWGVLDTKAEAEALAKREALRLAKADSDKTPTIGSRPATTMPGQSNQGTPATPDPVPQAPPPLVFG